MLRVIGTNVIMATHVQHAYIESHFLTIPSVRVLVRVDNCLTVIYGNGTEPLSRSYHWDARKAGRQIERKLVARNWRTLRSELLNLDLDDAPSICNWLGSAGYVPVAILDDPNALYFTPEDVERISTDNLGWRSNHVTAELRQWLKAYRDVFNWISTLNNQQFRYAIKKVDKFRRDEQLTHETVVHTILFEHKTPNLIRPGTTFIKKLKAPELDAGILALALRGTAVSERSPAQLSWGDDGKPTVEAYASSPIAAICLAIHIDQFSSRSCIRCDRCGNWFDRIRGKDRFCTKKCRNYLTTSDRRAKVRLLQQAAEARKAVPKQRTQSPDRWQWMATWIYEKSKGQYEIEPLWAKQTLAKLENKHRRKASTSKTQI